MTYKQTYCLVDMKLRDKVPSHGTFAFQAALKDLTSELPEFVKVKSVSWELNTEHPHDGYLFDLTIETYE